MDELVMSQLIRGQIASIEWGEVNKKSPATNEAKE